jgi:hypothetical protein
MTFNKSDETLGLISQNMGACTVTQHNPSVLPSGLNYPLNAGVAISPL